MIARSHRFSFISALFALTMGILFGTPLAHAIVPPAAYFSGAQSILASSGLSFSFGVAVDGSGNVYIADTVNARVLKETLSGGVYSESTIGSGLSRPIGVAVDGNGNVYIADHALNQVLKETLSGGFYTQSVAESSALDQPYGVAVDGSGNIYIADSANARVLKETPSGGSYTESTIGTGLSFPWGLAVDGSGNVYIADSNNNLVLKETLSGGSYTQSTIVSSGLNLPAGIAVDGSGNVYIADSMNNQVLKETLSGGSYIESTAGSSLNSPSGVAVDGSGNVYIADTNNKRVLMESPSGSFGMVNVGSSSASSISLIFTFTSAGTIGSPAVLTQGATWQDFVDAGTGSCTTNASSHTYNPGDTCTVDVLSTPCYPGTRYGAAVLLDGSGNTLATGYVHGIGSGPQVNFLPGSQSTIASSGMSDPTGVAVDGNGNVYIVNWESSLVYKETLSGGSYTQSTIGSGLQGPTGIAVDGAGNVYIAGYDSNLVYKETLSGGVYTQSTIGSGLSGPMGVAVDGSGNVYIADTFNNRVLEETLSGDIYNQSTVPTSGLNCPKGVAVDGSGNVYIADAGNNQIVKETFSAGIYTQSTVASGLNDPYGVAVGGDGNVYITDTRNNQVLMLPSTGSGYGTQSTIGSGFGWPQGVAVDRSGNVFVADSNNNQAVKLDFADAPSLSFANTAVGSTSSDSPQQVTLLNIGNAPLIFPVPGSGWNPSLSDNFTSTGASTCPEVNSSGSPATLAANSSCIFELSFTPYTTGSISGALVLTDNALNVSNATQSVQLSGTATAPPVTTPTITWSPSLIAYGTPLGAAQLNATASVPGTFAYTPGTGAVLNAGVQTLSVTFTPTDTTDYTTATSTVMLTVSEDATTTTVQASAAAVLLQSNITLTATVASLNSTPMGSVTFMDGTTQLGTVTLGNTGTVALTLSTLALGTHNITATYAGSANFGGSTSSAITESVQDFSLNGGTATVLSATVMPGDKAIYTVQFSPQGGSTFVDAVTLTLTGLPSGASYTITPSTIPAGSGSTTVTVTVTAASLRASLAAPKGGIGFPKPLVLAIFLPLLGTRKLRRALRLQMKSSALMLLVLGVLMVTGMTACGGGSGFFSQAPQSYPMTMTGTSGALHHSVTLNLTVQ